MNWNSIITSDSFSFYGYYGIIPLLLFCIFILCVNYYKKNNKRSLLLPACVCFLAGIILYWIGFCHEGSEFSPFVLLMRSMLSSMEMFVSRNDLLEVSEERKNNTLYMVLFVFVHSMSVCLTMLAAFSLLGNNLANFFKRKWEAYLGHNKPLYIFFGVNETSLITARKIREEYKENARIIFIEFPESKNEHVNFESLVGLSSLKHGLSEQIGKMGLLYYGTTPIHEIQAIDPRKTVDIQDTYDKEEYFSIFDKIGVSDIKRFITKSNVVKLFLLSNSQKENLQAFEAICSDAYILENKRKNSNSLGDKSPKFIVYCLARRDSQNIVYENDYLEVEKVEVHIIDKSLLTVHYMKSNLRYCPISFVEQKNGVVTSKFNSLIVGFGETGQDIFDFLYEFSAFEGDRGGRSDFHCLAIDENMDCIGYKFLHERPALTTKHDMLELSNIDYKTKGFWQRIKTEIRTLNYVFIALGDDEKSLSLAIDIYNFAVKERLNDLNKFKIFVRVYNYENEKRMNNIASYYNQRNPFPAKKEYPNFIDERVEEREGEDGTIVIVGELDEIFNLHYLYNEDEEQEKNSVLINAKSFYYNYHSINSNKKIGEIETNSETVWKERREKCFREDTNKLFMLRSLSRKERQDMSNSLHINTKIKLLGLVPQSPVVNEDDKASMIQKMDRMIDIVQSMRLQKDVSEYDRTECELIKNVGKTEHLRWLAAQEIMGYLPTKEVSHTCDEIAKTHGCMHSWEELAFNEYDTRKFDFGVIETSLIIKKNQISSISPNK